MSKISSHIKKHKKTYLFGVFSLLLIAGLALFAWNSPCTQFKRYCKEKGVCECAASKLSKSEKKAFVLIAKYMEKIGKPTLDGGILKYITAEELSEVGLKMKSCSADVARQVMLDNNAQSRGNFPGDYNCMRQVLMNELSNEEVLFLQSPQSKSLEAIKNPAVQNMYLTSSAKLMKCMNEQIQKKYLEEVDKIKAEASKQAKKKK